MAPATDSACFSTTYVEPESRNQAIAPQLLQHGEAWTIGHRMTRAVTDTSARNDKRINLYQGHGSTIVDAQAGMI